MPLTTRRDLWLLAGRMKESPGRYQQLCEAKLSKRPTADSAIGAYTLLELLVVMAVIVVLLGLVLGTARYSRGKAKETAAKSQLHQISVALELYRNDYGQYPITPSNAPRLQNTSHLLDGGTTNNADALYTLLTGYSTANGPPNAPDISDGYYPELKPKQIHCVDNHYYFVDPYGNVWGYFNTTNAVQGWTSNQFNPHSYDLWSFGADPSDPVNSPITNWRQR